MCLINDHREFPTSPLLPSSLPHPLVTLFLCSNAAQTNHVAVFEVTTGDDVAEEIFASSAASTSNEQQEDEKKKKKKSSAKADDDDASDDDDTNKDDGKASDATGEKKKKRRRKAKEGEANKADDAKVNGDVVAVKQESLVQMLSWSALFVSVVSFVFMLLFF